MVMESVSIVAEAAIAPAMISACTCRLRIRASMKKARDCERYRMPMNSANRLATFRNTIRRVRLEEP